MNDEMPSEPAAHVEKLGVVAHGEPLIVSRWHVDVGAAVVAIGAAEMFERSIESGIFVTKERSTHL
jgi:uncharacterized membrane protein